jgi:hypothetical protein
MQNYSVGLFVSIILHLAIILSLSDFLKIKIEDLIYAPLDPLKTFLVYEKSQNVVKPILIIPKKENSINLAKKITNKDLLEEKQRVVEEIKNEILSLPKNTKILDNQTDLISLFSSVIQSQVMSEWKRPQSLNKYLKTELLIRLVPTGEILEIKIIKSSGNKAFDQSSITALESIKKFEGLEMSNRLFDKHFRNFTLIFSPSDL